jgi:hypothetical protein
LSVPHCIIDESLLNFADCFRLGIPKFLTKRDAVSLLQALGKTRMRRTRVTPLRYLSATDASGGIARQQNIIRAHEIPFYHYAQFPHHFAITYRGIKYSRMCFGQIMYMLVSIITYVVLQ